MWKDIFKKNKEQPKESCSGCCCGRRILSKSLIPIDGIMTTIIGLNEMYEPYLSNNAPPADIDFQQMAKEVRNTTTLMNVSEHSLVTALEQEYARRIKY